MSLTNFMKKDQFRSMVKEIIKEVISEIDDTGKQHNQYPKDDPEGTEGGMSSDQKIAGRQQAWKSWGDKMKMLKGIHDEPKFKDDLKKLRQRSGDEPFTEMGKQHSQYPKDDPAGTEGGMSSDQKIAYRQDRHKVGNDVTQSSKTLRSKIHDEPGFKDQLKKLRQSKGDEPFDN